MATKNVVDYKVIMSQLDSQEAVAALERVHGQYTMSLAADQKMVFVHHIDLAYLIVMAALWAQEGR